MNKKNGKKTMASIKAAEKNRRLKGESFRYPPDEDIYNMGVIADTVNPEDVSTLKDPVEWYGEGAMNETDFETDISGGDLDVPGAELDDEQEANGSEDEENNYYSLGGDAHENLEENQGG